MRDLDIRKHYGVDYAEKIVRKLAEDFNKYRNLAQNLTQRLQKLSSLRDKCLESFQKARKELSYYPSYLEGDGVLRDFQETVPTDEEKKEWGDILTSFRQLRGKRKEYHEKLDKVDSEHKKDGCYTGILYGCSCGCLSIFLFPVLIITFYPQLLDHENIGYVGWTVIFISMFVGIVLYYLRLHITRSRIKSAIDRLTSAMEQRGNLAEQFLEAAIERKNRGLASAREALDRSWRQMSEEIRKWRGELESLRALAPFANPLWNNWEPYNSPPKLLRIGVFGGRRVIDQNTQWTGELEAIPMCVPFPVDYGLLVESSPEVREEALRGINAILARILAITPPGKLRFTIIDPVALGDSVAWLLNLRSYDESTEDSLITGRAWVEQSHIQKQLSVVKEQITTIIQEKLLDKYETIEEYNEKEGEIAEPYRIVVVFDFPAGFSNEAAEALLSIAQTGPRCGVYPIILMDTSRKLPYGFNLGDLEDAMWVISNESRYLEWKWRGWKWFADGGHFAFEQPPDGAFLKQLVDNWGRIAKSEMKVEVPFNKVLDIVGIHSGREWNESARDLLMVPLGPAGGNKVQCLELGKGTLNHALVVGRTGSGKSNLLHVLITASALVYPPSELRLYLIDLKTVEFVIYSDLPHAEVVAVDADREYALNVLVALYEELMRRMELFKQVAANDIAEYREKRPDEKMPRILLIVDEFQVLFEYDDRVAGESARILDRVVRQGRAFGIHVLLGSQSLAGRTIPRATMDQMGVRIALQCSDADSRLILSEDNPAARHLRRPGEAIYNSANGLIEGNSQFQVAYFNDKDRDYCLRKIRTLAEQQRERGEVVPKPVIFEGNEAAYLERSLQVQEKMVKFPPARPRVAEALVGEPIALKPPVAVRFARRSGSHLVVVTREEEQGVGMTLSAIVSLCTQYHPDTVSFFIADFTTADAEWAVFPEVLADNFPHDIKVVGRRELLDLLKELHNVLQTAIEQNEPLQQDIYLVLLGLHRIRDLRQQEDVFASFSEDAQLSPTMILTDLLRDGPEMGIHLLLWCDTVANLRRTLDRRMMGELGIRIAGAMSELDSSELIDDSAAGRLDKPNRVVLYDDEHPGVLTKLRPFIIRDANWLKLAGSVLKAS